jgi:hypothetical protein
VRCDRAIDFDHSDAPLRSTSRHSSILQIALIVKLAPPLALALRADALAGLAPEGWPRLLQLFAMASCRRRHALALVFPAWRSRATGAPAPCAFSASRVGDRLAIAGVASSRRRRSRSRLAPRCPRDRVSPCCSCHGRRHRRLALATAACCAPSSCAAAFRRAQSSMCRAIPQAASR